MATQRTNAEPETCIACGWDLQNPYRGRVVSPDQIFRFTVKRADGEAEAEFGAHAICLLREQPAMGFQIAAAAGLVHGETEDLTDLGKAAVAAGRVA